MLTDRQIQTAIKTVATEVTLNDGAGGKNLGSLVLVVRRTKTGVSSLWFAKWKAEGKQRKKSMGSYPDLSLAIARQKFATEIRPLIQAGKDPANVAAPADRPTVAGMFEAYVASMRAKGRASADEVERMLLKSDASAARFFGPDRLAADISEGDMVELAAKFYRKGSRGAADKMRSYVSSAFNWAIRASNDYTDPNRRDWGVTENPAEKVQRDNGAIGTRDRNLSAAEIRALWAAADGIGVPAAIRLLLCCGQRVQETLRIEAHEIDLEECLWRMPAPKTKGRKQPHTIPLPALAVEVLRPLVEDRKGWLFPSRNGSKGELIDHRSVQQWIDRWLAVSGVQKFQTRDLRRTWKSRAHDAGVDRFTRDLIQQHAKGDTGSKNYDRAEYLPQMREAMEKWNTWLSEVVAK